jgi:vacuolar-type H+-ATPase subunit D/Vma8
LGQLKKKLESMVKLNKTLSTERQELINKLKNLVRDINRFQTKLLSHRLKNLEWSETQTSRAIQMVRTKHRFQSKLLSHRLKKYLVGQ